MTDRVTWDCHVHVIGDPGRYPLAPGRGYDPPSAPLKALMTHLDALAIDRAVIVQPSVYGFDDSCLVDMLRAAGGRCVGIAVPSPEAGLPDLAALQAAGVRGMRCNLVNPGGLPLEATRGWWGWMRAEGWHLQVQIDATRTDLDSLVAMAGLPDLVVDHMGYPPKGATAEDLRPLLRLVGAGRAYVKLSAPYRISAMARPYADACALAGALLAAAPERCLFATDWPHTEHAGLDGQAGDWLETVRDLAGRDWPRLQEAAERLYGG